MTQEALKLALDAMNAMLTHMGMDEDEFNKVTYDQMRQAIAAADKALAQEQEPVAWADHGVVNWIADKQFKHAALLYEAPQRTWVGLTDEEIDNKTRKAADDLLDHIYEYGTASEGVNYRIRKLARVIETAHGIKEST